jgi:hypothetical protein
MQRLVYSAKDLSFRNRSKDSLGRRWFDLTYGHEVFLGYYTGASLSFGGRLGLFQASNWAIDNSPLGNLYNIFGLSSGRPSVLRFLIPDVFVSSEIKPTMMLYNAMLRGQFRKSDYTISGANTNPFLYTWTNTLSLEWSALKYRFSIAYNFYSKRSAEFRRDDYYGRPHDWGGIYLSFTSFY